MTGPTTVLGDRAASPPREGGSPFRAFDDDYFVDSEAWAGLRKILDTNGGAYALSGPRGAGKSWLMLKALSHTSEMGGLALWYPSPSNYSAFEFLSTLSDNFANQIERRYRPDRFYPTLASSPWRVVAGSVLVTLGIVLVFRLPAENEFLRTLGLLGLAGTLAVMLWSLWKRGFGSAPAAHPVGDVDGATPRVRRRHRRRRERRRDPRPVVTMLLGERPEKLRPRLRFIFRLYALVGTIAVSAYLVGNGVGGEGFTFSEDAIRGLVLATVALFTGFAILVATLRGVAQERQPERLLTREAALLRERIRYSSRTKEATEVGAKGGGAGLGGGVKAAREKELVERPTTVASLIHDFRALAERAAEVSGRVVIAIDELDKIADADAVRALLRDIKGIFEVTGVFFLVSVSDEATRSLNLGGVAGRDEFNSSFYTVIEVSPMDGRFLTEFFAKRGTRLDPHVAAALSLLAGNNPRETLRLADPVLRSGAGEDVHRAVSATMLAEVRAFRAQAMAATAPGWRDGLDDDERGRLAAMLGDARFAPACFAETARELMNEWSPDWAGPYWAGHQQDAWRRLLIRLHVAAEALDEDADMAALAEVLTALEESPVVARQAILSTRRASGQVPQNVR